MPLGKATLISFILLFSVCSGCTLLQQTKFTFLSLSIDDAAGFPQLSVRFNTSDTTTLTLLGPQKTTIFSETYYYGAHNEHISFGEYRITPSSGTYVLEACDKSKNTIFKNEFLFNGPDASLSHISDVWWDEGPDESLIGLVFSVRNTGDLPAYLYSVTVQQGEFSSQALLVPTVILPSHTKQIQCFVHLNDFSDGQYELLISLNDKEGNILTQTTQEVTPSDPISSWEYQWYYQGGNVLEIPDVDWFSIYYKSLKRFDITDYAAYVFDPYDDSIIKFVTEKVLSLTESTGDVERINFLASFVQNLEYAKDDPLNESYEYPRYPLETLQEQQGDCEDKAILTAALLTSLGYNVSLIRLPTHMAVGVHINETLPEYLYFIDEYYYLESTTPHMPLGKIPKEYEGLTNVTVYSLSSRPLLLHTWENATRYTINDGHDYVKVKLIMENLGNGAASSIVVKGAFFTAQDQSYNQETTVVSTLAAGDKHIVELTIDVPSFVSTVLKTQLYLNAVMVHQRESTARFP